MRKRLAPFFLAFVLTCACEPNYEKTSFNFPVEIVKLPKSSSLLSPSLVSDNDYQSSLYRVMDDTLLVSASIYKGGKNAFMVANIQTADTVMSFARKGRGPGEVLRPDPYFFLKDGHMYFVDMMTSKLYDFNIRKSIHESREIYDSIIPLNASNTFSSYSDIALVGKDSLLCYDTCIPAEATDISLQGIPYFTLFDLGKSKIVGEYRYFNEIPLKQKSSYKSNVQLFSSFHGCSNFNSGSYCFAMVRFPQINFLDPKTGHFSGIRFENGPRASMRHPHSCFQSICTDGDRIFAIYSGAKLKKLGHANTSLIVFDWKASGFQRYDLDGPYFQCDVASDGLYLARADSESKLYFLPFSDMN